jgi:predicted signal transduction protein with EAL and GGDEF domain
VAFAKAVRKALSAPIRLQDQEIFLTASIGIASALETGAAPEDLLRDAAVALYEAKRRGKDSAEVFRPTMRDDSMIGDARAIAARGGEERLIHYRRSPVWQIWT